MAIDVVAACAASESAATPQGFLVGLSTLFAFYIGIDALVSILVVRRVITNPGVLK